MKRRVTGSANSGRSAAGARAPAAPAAVAATPGDSVGGTDWYERAKLPAHRTPLDLPLLELECMKILWQLGEAPVWQIREILSRRRPLAYTTVETLMNRLVKKGAVSRRKQGAVYLYWPECTREEAFRHALQRLLDHFFYGSRESLLAYLSGKKTEAGMAVLPESQPRRRAALPPPAPVRRKAGAKPGAGKHEPEPAEAGMETSLL